MRSILQDVTLDATNCAAFSAIVSAYDAAVLSLAGRQSRFRKDLLDKIIALSTYQDDEHGRLCIDDTANALLDSIIADAKRFLA